MLKVILMIELKKSVTIMSVKSEVLEESYF
jgi:hypothetical protein